MSRRKKPDTDTAAPAPGANGHADEFDLEDIDLAATIQVATETLTGDVRDFVLDTLKHEQNKRPWHERSEAEQRDTVHRVESMAQDLVRQAVELLAAQGRRVVKATVESITIKDGIKAVLSLSKFDAQRHALADSQGATVLLVVADPDAFAGERAPVEIKPDQPELLAGAMAVHSTPDGTAETPFEG